MDSPLLARHELENRRLAAYIGFKVLALGEMPPLLAREEGVSRHLLEQVVNQPFDLELLERKTRHPNALVREHMPLAVSRLYGRHSAHTAP